MTKYVIKRLVLIIPVLLGVSFILFAIMNLTPGDPAQLLIGETYTKEGVEKLREELGLNQPFFERYIKYIMGVVKGDFGISYKTRNPVFQEIFARFPNTVIITILAIIIQIIIGISVGIIAAVKQYSLVDTISQTITLILASVPDFWIGLMLLILFSVKLKLLPLSGIESFKGYLLPSIAVGMPYTANMVRMTRSTMMDVLRMDYIVTAQAKGVTEMQRLFRHALKNAMLPIVTVCGVNLSWALGGTIVIEQVFNISGIGSLMIQSIHTKDTPVVMGTVLFVALLSCLINLATDLIYAFIDPRVKSEIKG